MKIKCPACSKVLSVPDAAAGKKVKCPCGKQLMAPKLKGAAAAPAQGSAAAASPQRPVASTPGRSPAGSVGQPAAAAGGLDDFFLDELTENDLTPVKPVAMPGRPTQAAESGALAGVSGELDKENAERKKDVRATATKHLRKSIGLLIFLGVLRLGFSIFLFVIAPGQAEAVAEGGEEAVEILVAAIRLVCIIEMFIGFTFFACAGLIFWFPMTCSIVAMCLFILTEIIGLLLNPFRLVSISGWVIRGAIFGGLMQTINSASYYKFVKAGGRD